MHITFNGIYGIDNIKIINKHRLELEEIHNTYGLWINPDSDKKYKIFKDILLEIYDKNTERIIVEHYNDKEFFGSMSRKNVDWFIDHKCCWKDQQYRLKDYYQLMVDAPMGPYYMVIVVLKEVIYTNEKDKLKVISYRDNLDEVWRQPPSTRDMIPELTIFTTIKETDQEFKDAYIVVRNNEL
jgi:hypothetical protein